MDLSEYKIAVIGAGSWGTGKNFVVAGGVAANKTLRAALTDYCERRGFHFHAPPLKYCTDNGVMIAQAGLERFAAGVRSGLDHPAPARQNLKEIKI